MNLPAPGRIEVGRIEVITGPMFSGKSEELIRRLKRGAHLRASGSRASSPTSTCATTARRSPRTARRRTMR